VLYFYIQHVMKKKVAGAKETLPWKII
jgi:hypothetical protein